MSRNRRSEAISLESVSVAVRRCVLALAPTLAPSRLTTCSAAAIPTLAVARPIPLLVAVEVVALVGQDLSGSGSDASGSSPWVV